MVSNFLSGKSDSDGIRQETRAMTPAPCAEKPRSCCSDWHGGNALPFRVLILIETGSGESGPGLFFLFD